jgi:hypothetical protein
MEAKIQDIEIYRKKWQIVRSYDEFVAWIERHGLPDFISFDHDLGLPEDSNTEEQNGMTCAHENLLDLEQELRIHKEFHNIRWVLNCSLQKQSNYSEEKIKELMHNLGLELLLVYTNI